VCTPCTTRCALHYYKVCTKFTTTCALHVLQGVHFMYDTRCALHVLQGVHSMYDKVCPPHLVRASRFEGLGLGFSVSDLGFRHTLSAPVSLSFCRYRRNAGGMCLPVGESTLKCAYSRKQKKRKKKEKERKNHIHAHARTPTMLQRGETLSETHELNPPKVNRKPTPSP
jgi:hypothetical protein